MNTSSPQKNWNSRAHFQGSMEEQQKVRSWHTVEIKNIFRILKSSAQGLPMEEVSKRLELFGRNEIPRHRTPSVFIVFLRQFASPLIYILLAAGVISTVIGKSSDAIFIFGVVMLNSVIGAFQEYKSEKSAESLQKLLKYKANIRRSGRLVSVDSSDIVPGDIVLLESGVKVPADLRLISTANFQVDESLLTGESLAVEKSATVILDEGVPIADQKNMVFAGSSAISGRAEGVAVLTGVRTELGKISKKVIEAEAAKPPLLIRMEIFARYLSYVVLAAVAIFGVIAWLQGHPLEEVLLLSIALAVAAIPEGLPVAMTVALAIGVKRMARRNVIVRKLPSVEGLGSCTYIASDKTGTLTVNKQTARVVALPTGVEFSHLKVTGEAYQGEGEIRDQEGAVVRTRWNKAIRSSSHIEAKLEQLIEALTLCNEAKLERTNEGWISHGDAIDVAFLALAYKAGIDPTDVRKDIRIVGTVPYESERQFAAEFYTINGEVRVAAKGATEKLLSLCKNMKSALDDAPLNAELIRKEENRLAAEGYRILSVAKGKLEQWDSSTELTEKHVPSLTFLGFVGFIDPLRPEAKEAILKCKRAGIQVGMITGDHPGTALSISKQLGLAETPEDVITGRDLQGVEHGEREPTPELTKKIGATHVFARVNPMQKVWIVELLRRAGHFVAVTGDGVNDSPALRRANIGVAMGSGSDVAKEAASIIIIDDNFASIEAGIEEGRFVYENVRKVIYLLLATGSGSILLFCLSLLAELPMPLIAVQLLWLNLVTNGIQDVGLAFEKGEAGAMSKPPRGPKERIFNPLMLQEVFIVGLSIGLVAFGVWWWMIEHKFEVRKARNLLLLLMVFFGNFHTLNSRSEKKSAFSIPLRNNPILIVGMVIALIIHFASLYLPFMHDILQSRPVSFMEIIIILLLASTVLIVSEIFKKFVSKVLQTTQ